MRHFAAEEPIHRRQKIVRGGHPRALERDAGLGRPRHDDAERRAARPGMFSEERLELGEALGRGLLGLQPQLDARGFGGAHIGQPAHLVHLDLRRRLGVLGLRLGPEFLRQPHHPFDQHRLVAFEQRLVLLRDVVVDDAVARAGQVLEAGEGDLLSRLGEALAPPGDDARHRHLLEPLGAGERGAGVRGVALHVFGVAGQGVAGDVEADRLFLQREALALRPLFLAGDALFGRRVGPGAGEEPELARLAVLLRRRPGLQRRLARLEERLARLAGEVEGAGADQRLEHLLVQLAHVDARAEIEQSREGLLPGGEDGLDGVFAHALDGPQPEADDLLPRLPRVGRDAEGEQRLVDVGLQHGDAAGARLGDMGHHLVGVVLLAGEERGHELDRVMRLEPRRLVGDEPVSRRVGVVDDEAVGDEVVIALDSEVVRLLAPTRLDGDDAVPVDVRIRCSSEAARAKCFRQSGDGAAPETALRPAAISRQLSCADAAATFELAPCPPMPDPLLGNPAADLRRHRVLAAEPDHPTHVSPQFGDLRFAGQAVRRHSIEESLDGAIADEVHRPGRPLLTAIFEYFPVHRAGHSQSQQKRLYVYRKPLRRRRIEWRVVVATAGDETVARP